MLQKLKKVLIVSFFLILITAFTSGCSQQTAGSTEVTASGGLGIKTDVEIKDFKFNPQTVTIPAGTTVIWTNNDSTIHAVLANTGNEIDSGTISPGETFAHMFNNPGTYEYHCSIHTTMVGKVIVEPSTLGNNQK
jgi:plastocyanin